MAHKLSLAYLTTADVGPLEALKIAAKTGYDMIGFRLLPASPADVDHPLMSNDMLLRETISVLNDTGVLVGDVEIVRLNAETMVGNFEGFLQRAKQLGARHVLVAGDDFEQARLIDNFGQFCRLAGSYGLTADLEFMPWTEVPDLNTARQIVEAANEPNGGVLIDALHYDRSETTLEDVSDLPSELIHYVQFCDGPVPYDPSDEEQIRIARSARLLPGDGGIDLRALARVIPKDVTISVEIADTAGSISADPMERARLAREATFNVLQNAVGQE